MHVGCHSHASGDNASAGACYLHVGHLYTYVVWGYFDALSAILATPLAHNPDIAHAYHHKHTAAPHKQTHAGPTDWPWLNKRVPALVTMAHISGRFRMSHGVDGTIHVHGINYISFAMWLPAHSGKHTFRGVIYELVTAASYGILGTA